MYPEILFMLIVLIGFIAFLAYQGFLALYPSIHKGYSWIYGFKMYRVHLPSNVTDSPYYGKKIGKYTNLESMYSTIDDPVLKNVAAQLDFITKRMTPTQKANCILKFVQQNIIYTKDKTQCDRDECWHFPVNTLVRKKGDCEDSAFLCAGLMHLCGLDVINVDMVGHITCAVNVPAIGKKYTVDDVDYYRAETTSAFIQYVGICLNQDTEIERLIKPTIPSDGFKDLMKDE